jgi:hypothetical protein
MNFASWQFVFRHSTFNAEICLGKKQVSVQYSPIFVPCSFSENRDILEKLPLLRYLNYCSTDRTFGNLFPSTCRQNRDAGMLVCSHRARTLKVITHNRSHIYIYICTLYRSIWLFNCQTSYWRYSGREISFIYIRGGNFIKISDVQAVCCFMSDIQTPPILEHQRTMVSDQTGIEAHPL